jgi:hypothetical protein
MQLKKGFVLIVLFILPLVAYLFFASGVNNFAKLPVLKENIEDINGLGEAHQETLNKKITILCFFGDNIETYKSGILNLNQKIYQQFHEFKDFQFVMIQPKGSEEKVQNVLGELKAFTDEKGWKVIYADKAQITSYYQKLETELPLDAQGGTPYVFIIDKEQNLRGRTDDEEVGMVYGFNVNSAAELHNKMKDDVKIVLAEYRLALKKNNKYKEKRNER